MGVTEMSDKSHQEKRVSKFEEAKGLFWGASLFAGALTAVILGFRGNMRSDWLFAALAGGCVFLFFGLIAQGIITLLGRD